MVEQFVNEMERLNICLFVVISLILLTQATCLKQMENSKVVTSSTKKLDETNRLRKTSLVSSAPSSLVSSIRNTMVPFTVVYYNSSSSCRGSPSYATSSTAYVNEPVGLYDYIQQLNIPVPPYVYPALLNGVTIEATGCGRSMSLKVCYFKACTSLSLNDCIDIDNLVTDQFHKYIGTSNYGSAIISVMGPSCSSGGVHCFSSDSKVYLENSQHTDIVNVQSNDYILTYDPNERNHKWTKVIGWLDKREDVKVSFSRIIHEMGYLKASPYHLIMKVGSDGQVKPVFTKDIQIGDILLFHNMSLTAYSKVVQIENIIQFGAFAPLTTDGTFLVNGILVSCYAHFASHTWAHLAFAPYRWYYSIIGSASMYPSQWYIHLLKAVLSWSSRLHLTHGLISK